MSNENAAPSTRSEEEYAWMRDGSVPYSREDLLAEVLAVLALVFSLGIGLVIALLPVSAQASPLDQAAAAPRLLPAVRIACVPPAWMAQRARIEYPVLYLDRPRDGAREA